jgi:hypothetical protein
MTGERLLSIDPAEWPALDRAAWERALAPADSLFDEHGGAGERYSTAALRKVLRSYSEFLSFLARIGQLDEREPSAARVTPARLNGWIADQRGRGNRSTTIYGRLRDLHAALRLIAPGADVSFILRPGGRSLRRLLHPSSRQETVRDPRELLACAVALFEAGRSGRGYAQGRAAIRDAALLGLLAAHAPRIGSIARMKVGEHLTPIADGYRLDFGEKDTKTRCPLTYNLNPELVPLFDHYLRVVRPSLAGSRTSAALWIGVTGGAPNESVLSEVVRRRTRAWLGRARGPHWFRKCLRSFASNVEPRAAFDAAVMMGHGPQVSIDHYAKATASQALRRHGARITKARRTTWSLAASAFGWREEPAASAGRESARGGSIMCRAREGR